MVDLHRHHRLGVNAVAASSVVAGREAADLKKRRA